jgi:hypothetical protein
MISKLVKNSSVNFEQWVEEMDQKMLLEDLKMDSNKTGKLRANMLFFFVMLLAMVYSIKIIAMEMIIRRVTQRVVLLRSK